MLEIIQIFWFWSELLWDLPAVQTKYENVVDAILLPVVHIKTNATNEKSNKKQPAEQAKILKNPRLLEEIINFGGSDSKNNNAR